MKKYTLYIIAAFAAVLFASSCDDSRRGTIEGVITGAEGKLLVLEHLTDGNPRMVDTIRLDASGKFKFRPVVEKGPDFFCVRIENQTATVSIDTLLTPVEITAVAEKLANEYEVSDEKNKELKDALMLGNRLRRQVYNLAQEVNNGTISSSAGRDSLAALVGEYKGDVLAKYVYRDPASPASYIILHETVNGLLIFDSNNASDNRAFGAVATSWGALYPNSPRTKVLEQRALDGQRLRYAARQQAAAQDSILSSKIQESGFPILNLRNADDHEVSLNSLVNRNSVVLVDFTAYALNASPAHNIVLGELYKKYEQKGLKIYQVALDFEENFWKTSADNLPWTTVRDEEILFDINGNIQHSPAAALYNVKSLPTTYIIGKDGNLKVRVEDDSKLESELKKYL